MEVSTKYQERTYRYDEVCSFRKTKELFGGLSNMASGFPIKVNGIYILTSEALYQACRFPHLPDVQRKIINEKSPMTAKMVGKPFRSDTRPDWDNTRVDIMYWCLRVKLAQNFITFGQLLETTCNKPIVEDSNKDPFWGAVKDKKNESYLVGVNALGRLLMKLRQEYNSAKRYDLLFVEPLNIPNFLLYGDPIHTIDERQSFIDNLQKHWRLKPKQEITIGHINIQKEQPYINGAEIQTNQSIVSEPETKIEKTKKPRAKRQTKKKEVANTELPFT
jgi:ribA/ribD-fused uncharacterized protein